MRGVTQVAMAEKAGANRVSVAEIETGRKQSLIAPKCVLADALDVSPGDPAE